MTDSTAAAIQLLENALEMAENDRARRDIVEAKQLLEAGEDARNRSAERVESD